jgi:hypothetical protein
VVETWDDVDVSGIPSKPGKPKPDEPLKKSFAEQDKR